MIFVKNVVLLLLLLLLNAAATEAERYKRINFWPRVVC